MASCGQRAARIRPDRICLIQLPAPDSVLGSFPKKTWVILCRTDPDPIWMAWSGFGQMHLVWKQANVQESSGPVSGRTQPARYRFPSFRLGCVLPQTAWIILCKTSPDPIGFWLILCQVLAKTDPVREQAGVQGSSGPLLANAFKLIRIRPGMFTGIVYSVLL